MAELFRDVCRRARFTHEHVRLCDQRDADARWPPSDGRRAVVASASDSEGKELRSERAVEMIRHHDVLGTDSEERVVLDLT